MILGQQYTISSGNWQVQQQDDNTYLVISSSTGEQHTAYSYRSAYFLQQMFNDQHYWYNYERHGTTITLSSSLTLDDSVGLTVHSMPQANWRYTFGDSKDTYFQFYLKNGPNAFQRWAYYKILGIKWEKIK